MKNNECVMIRYADDENKTILWHEFCKDDRQGCNLFGANSVMPIPHCNRTLHVTLEVSTDCIQDMRAEFLN